MWLWRLLCNGLLGNQTEVRKDSLKSLILLKFSRTWNGKTKKLYLDTDSSTPFCTHLYTLEIELASTKRAREAESWIQGYLKITLIGDKNSLIEHDLTKG